MLRRCMGCMQEYDDQYEICPHCGYVFGTEAEEAYHLQPGNILQGKYIVGKVLGFGGFGVTYIGWDAELERIVAIKEYLPSEFATRMPEQTQVTVFSGDREEQFTSGMTKFVDEAKRLAKFHHANGIVHIFDSFSENNTAYIVMEYLEGESLKERLARDGKIPIEEATEIMLSVLYGLKEVHKQGIIHRDIAPDNIFLTNQFMEDGRQIVKLLDFGSARFATTKHSRSLSVLIKPGYSPEEQYRSHGDQGPWTDVYACAATLYKMITGVTPQDSMERNVKDEVKAPSKLGVKISKGMENAILNAMNIKIENRTPSIDTFIEELENEQTIRKKEKIKKTDVGKWPLWLKVASGSAAAFVAGFAILLVTGVIHFNIGRTGASQVPEGQTRVPNVVNLLLDDVEDALSSAKIQYTIIGKDFSDIIPKDCILSQSYSAGNLVEENSMMEIAVSGGPQTFEVPDVVGYEVEEATAMMEEATFSVLQEQTYDAVIAEGYVVTQSEEAGSLAPHDSVITLAVSLGRNPDEKYETKDVVMPELVGKTMPEAIAEAQKYGICLAVSEKKYSTSYDANVVMKQDVAAGTTFSNSNKVSLVVSLGTHYVTMPDVTFMTESEAKEILTKNDLSYSLTKEKSETVAAGLIISQKTPYGEKVLAGSKVPLVISIGRGNFDMPNVVGESESNAKASLNALGLSVSVSYEKSDEVKSGNVITQSVLPGESVTAGTKVSLIVSSGESLYTVPNVVGLTQESAISTLKENNFKVTVNSVYDNTVKAGVVMAQTLAAGGQYKKNTEIAITVSQGRQPVTVSFEGNGGTSGQSSATVYLGGNYGALPSASREEYIFNGWFTAASGGSKVDSSTIVSIPNNHSLYAQWTQKTYSVPNVVGSSQSSAQSSLSQYFTVSVSMEFNASVPLGNVISQGIAAGTQAVKGTVIPIVVSKGASAPQGWTTDSSFVGNPYYTCQTKTQYRKSTRSSREETIDSTEANLSGWEAYGTPTVTTSEWSAWSGWAQGTAPSSSDTTQYEGHKFYHYEKWECPCGRNCFPITGLYCNNGEAANNYIEYIDFDETTTYGGIMTFGGTGYYYYYKNGNSSDWYWNQAPVYYYRSRTRSVTTTYHYKRTVLTDWSNWSDWQDSVITEDNYTQVQTRTVYLYTAK